MNIGDVVEITAGYPPQVPMRLVKSLAVVVALGDMDGETVILRCDKDCYGVRKAPVRILGVLVPAKAERPAASKEAGERRNQ